MMNLKNISNYKIKKYMFKLMTTSPSHYTEIVTQDVPLPMTVDRVETQNAETHSSTGSTVIL